MLLNIQILCVYLPASLPVSFPLLAAMPVVIITEVDELGDGGGVVEAEQLLPSWAIISPLSHSSQMKLLDSEQFTQPST